LRAILHVGTHKTGTTSIQVALDHNRNWLHERGYIYPKLRDGAYSHNKLAQQLASTEQGNINVRSNFARISGHTLIFSAEELFAATACPEDWQEFGRPDYWERRIEQLVRVRAALRDFEETVVVLCFRRQDEFASSLYATKILSGRFLGSFAEFRSRAKPLFDYRRQLDAFRTVFGNVRFISFDALRDDLVPAFCRWAGIPVPPEKTAERQNVTPDARLVQWAYKSRIADDPARLNKLRGAFAKYAHAKTLLRPAEKAVFWSSDLERRSFLAECANPQPELFAAGDETVRGDRLTYAGGEATRDFSTISEAFEAWCLTQQKLRKRHEIRSLIAPFGTLGRKLALAIQVWKRSDDVATLGFKPVIRRGEAATHRR
jgi:hypothetical protein